LKKKVRKIPYFIEAIALSQPFFWIFLPFLLIPIIYFFNSNFFSYNTTANGSPSLYENPKSSTNPAISGEQNTP